MPTDPVAKFQAERLLELHDELDRMSAGPGMAKTALSLGASLAGGIVALRVLQLGLGSSVGPEFLVIFLVSVSLVAGLGIFTLLRRRTLRREIAELEAVDTARELPTETA